MITTESPLLSTDHINLAMADRMAKRIVATTTGYGQTEVSVIIGMYFLACAQTGVDPVIAIAQMLHETNYLRSWWSQPGRHNPAGIGVTGATSPTKPARGSWQHRSGVWHEGIAFPDWSDAVAAHVGRLLAYGGDEVVRHNHRVFINEALAWRTLPQNMLGRAPRLGDLTGRWATDPKYGEKLVRVANLFLG